MQQENMPKFTFHRPTLFIVLLTLFCLTGFLGYLFFSKPSSTQDTPQPIQKAPELTVHDSSGQEHTITLTKLNTIERVGRFNLINVPIRDIYNIFLQQWQIAPELLAEQEKWRAWAWLEASGVTTINLFGEVFHFKLTTSQTSTNPSETRYTIIQEKGSKEDSDPPETPFSEITFLSGAGFGEALWNTLEKNNIPFLLLLKQEVKQPKVGENVQEVLTRENLTIKKNNNIWIISQNY